MVAAFATAADLAARGWSGSASAERIAQALTDASNDLRAEIGWQVYPPVEISVSSREWSREVRLSGGPVRSITSVTVNDVALDSSAYELHDGRVLLSRYSGDAVVTYQVGYAAPPDELVRWTCVLAAQMLARADDDLGGGTPDSEALGEYRVSYSEQQQAGELPIPTRVLERLRSTYGQAVFVA